jgi:hypothetical protein
MRSNRAVLRSRGRPARRGHPRRCASDRIDGIAAVMPLVVVLGLLPLGSHLTGIWSGPATTPTEEPRAGTRERACTKAEQRPTDRGHEPPREPPRERGGRATSARRCGEGRYVLVERLREGGLWVAEPRNRDGKRKKRGHDRSARRRRRQRRRVRELGVPARARPAAPGVQHRVRQRRCGTSPDTRWSRSRRATGFGAFGLPAAL